MRWLLRLPLRPRLVLSGSPRLALRPALIPPLPFRRAIFFAPQLRAPSQPPATAPTKGRDSSGGAAVAGAAAASPKRWQVYRIDTHGNAAHVAAFDTPDAAHAMAEEYEARGHHQGYYVREYHTAAVDPHEARIAGRVL